MAASTPSTTPGQDQLATFASPSQELAYIKQEAAALGLDPEAVLAVAVQEGGTLPSNVGDQGTSFGPWQEHAGGALPGGVAQRGEEYAQEWANSQQGIDDALGKIAGVAKGQTGSAAVHSIVYGFENPLNPGAEYAAAVANYQAGKQPGLTSNPGTNAGPNSMIPATPRNIAKTGGSGGLGAAAGTPGFGSISSVTDALKFLTSWRFAEVVGGFLLLLVGLYLLGRQFGLAVPAPGPLARSSLQASETFQFEPGEAEYASRQPTSRARKTRMVSHTLPVDRKPARRPAAEYDYGDVPY